jgi:hypothetical protein
VSRYYFYIRDEVLGNLLVCVGSFLPFQTTPTLADQVPTKIQSAYNRADAAIQNLLDLLAAENLRGKSSDSTE